MPGQSSPRRLQGGAVLSVPPGEAKGQCLEKAAPGRSGLESWKSSGEQQGSEGAGEISSRRMGSARLPREHLCNA